MVENKEFWQNFQKHGDSLDKMEATEQYKAETDKMLREYRQKTASSHTDTELKKSAGEMSENQAMQLMLDQMKELKDEVKQLRSQLEENTFDIYAVPRGGSGNGSPRLIMTNGVGGAAEQQPQGDNRSTIIFDRGSYGYPTANPVVESDAVPAEVPAPPSASAVQSAPAVPPAPTPTETGAASDAAVNAAAAILGNAQLAAAAAAVAAAAQNPQNLPTGFSDASAGFDDDEDDDEEDTPKKKKFAWLGEAAFYALLIVMILGAFLIKSNSGGRPIIIAGYGAFTVLTSSMESEIPQGSLVITKEVDPQTLVVGDDITFMVSETTSVTHRIIGITENYEGTGQRAFQTKGVMNAEPDKEPAAAANVVGKVIWHSKLLGQIGNFISKNWPFLLFFAVVVGVLFAFLKWNFRDDGEDDEDDDPKPKKKPKKKKTQSEKSDKKAKKKGKKAKKEKSKDEDQGDAA